MSQWTQALTESRMEEAKTVYESLSNIEWLQLSGSDQRMRTALGYLLLESDNVNLADLIDADISGAGDGTGDQQ